MTKLSSEDRIIATLLVEDTVVIDVLEGKVVHDQVPFLYTDDVYITEAHLLQMNTFMRKKWEKVKASLDEEKRQRPLTPDNSVPGF